MTPHNPDAERSVLAALLNDVDGTMVDKAIADGLKPESFYDWQHGAIFGSMQRLRAKDVVPSVVTICQDLAGCGELDRVGGAGMVVSIANTEYSLNAFASHVEIVLCLASQRAAISQMRKVDAALSQEYLTRGELREAVSRPLAGVELAIQEQAAVRTTRNAIRDAVKKAHDIVTGNAEAVRVIKTGIPSFDKWCKPFAYKELITVAARPGNGKSSFAGQVAWHNVQQRKTVLLFTLEMDDVSFVERCAAEISGVAIGDLADALPAHQEKYAKALAKVDEFSDYIRIYETDRTIEAIETRCRVLRTAIRPDLIIIDHIGLLSGQGPRQNRNEFIGHITGRCMEMVKTMGCPVMMLSQLNRGLEREGNRQPVLSDLRDSGNLEQDSARVLFIHRMTKDRDGIDQSNDQLRSRFHSQIIQAKSRYGTRACINVDFHAPTQTFMEAMKL